MAHEKAKVVKRKDKPPLIKSPVGPSKRKPTPQEKFPSRADPLRGIGAGKDMEKWTTLSPAQKKMLKKSTTITPAEQRKIDKGIKERRMSLDKDVKAKSKPKKPPVGLEWKKKSKFKSTYGGPVRRTREAKRGGTVSKRNGGMTRVGLFPAEEARAGTLSEAARRRPRVPTPRSQAPVRPIPRPPVVTSQLPVRPVPPILRAHGSQVGKKKQGYKARKDESVAQRVKKKRTKKQLIASRHESYGKPGSGKGKGKINRISSKQTDGNKVVAAIYG